MKTQTGILTHVHTHLGSRLRTVALAAAVAVLALAAVPGAARAAGAGPASPAASAAPAVDRHAIVEAGSDVYLAPGQTADTIVVFDGDAVVAGTVRHSVVVFGGDVTVRDGARVGTQLGPDDGSIVVVGGTSSVAPGAQVGGEVHTLRHVSAGDAVVLGGLAGIGLGAVALGAVVIGLVALFAVPALIAAIVALIVWLARRESRTPVQPPAVPGGGAV